MGWLFVPTAGGRGGLAVRRAGPEQRASQTRFSVTTARWLPARSSWIVKRVYEDAVQRELDRAAGLADTRAALFEELAQNAEAIALTEERSADLHEKAAKHLPGASEHAARARRFAAAERAAAAAYREHRVPSDEIRQVIRDSGGSTPT
jgi:hypothetical protein